MKNIKFSLLALLFIAVTSCSEDDAPSKNNSMIVGDWKLEEFNYQGETSGTYQGMDLSSSYEGIGKNINATLSFNEDNTFDFQGDYEVDLSYEGMTQNYPMENVSSSGNWSVDGDYIITSSAIGQVQTQAVVGPQEGRMRISELTENRMVLIIDQESTMSQSGMDFMIRMGGKYVLSR